MLQPQVNRYLETSIQTATPAQLLIMLCDGAIRFCKAGIEAIQNRDYPEANRNLLKVQNIINEFIVTLDHNAPIAKNLLPLYEYFNYRLIEANTKKAAEPAEEVLQYLQELKDTWMEAAKRIKASGVGAVSQGTGLV